MPKLEVTYYTGEWSDGDREEVRNALQTAGFEVTESAGQQKSWQLVAPPQLLVDAIQVIKDVGPAVAVISGLLGLIDRLRPKKPNVSIQLITETRIYIVPNLGDEGVESVQAIPDDLKDGNPERKGDMTWKDGGWWTVDEL